MSVVTLFKKFLSWETRIKVCSYDLRYSSSQRTAGKSKWFVGSSSIKMCGRRYNAQAIATLTRGQAHQTIKISWWSRCTYRMRQPPDRDLVGHANI